MSQDGFLSICGVYGTETAGAGAKIENMDLNLIVYIISSYII